MIAILLHKTSVWYELHGWSPRYFTPDLKLEIGRRLQDRVMFGADYPLGYERLLGRWGLAREHALALIRQLRLPRLRERARLAPRRRPVRCC